MVKAKNIFGLGERSGSLDIEQGDYTLWASPNNYSRSTGGQGQNMQG